MLSHTCTLIIYHQTPLLPKMHSSLFFQLLLWFSIRLLLGWLWILNPPTRGECGLASAKLSNVSITHFPVFFSIASFTFSPCSHRARILCSEVYYYPSPCTDCYPTRCKLCVSSLYALIGQRCGWWLIAVISQLLKKASMCSYEPSAQPTLSWWSFKSCGSFPAWSKKKKK